MPLDPGNYSSDRAKNYSTVKYALRAIETAYLFIILLIFTGLGLSKSLQQVLFNFTTSRHVLVAAYLTIISLGYYLLMLPVNFYGSYTLEHRFSLSNQSLAGWICEQAKYVAVSYVICLIMAEVFYYLLDYNPSGWWISISLFWISFSLILARLTPIVILPLFFKYKQISDMALRDRIIKLADRAKIRIMGVFEIDFSSKTLKANAAFLGWGASRRVILSDTLQGKYSYDEIEVILAHEFAHYKQKHLLKMILLNSLLIIILFYAIFKTNNPILRLFGFSSLSEIGALPVILIYFLVFGVISLPLQNYVSRIFEKDADRMALSITGFSDAFISMMEKLSLQNLSDKAPHPLIKIFFFDHPPADERIALAKNPCQARL